MSKSSDERMMVMEGMLDEKEVEDKGSKVRIHQWRQVEFQSEEREIMVAEGWW